jgi:16S rRNA (cytosine1402-N4)-methyltransferase
VTHDPNATPVPHRRRPRYRGTHPRRFQEKYKEQAPEKYPETVAKVIASGKTPAGTHRPILLREILEILHPVAGEKAVDCTLGYGGHAREILPLLQPGGILLGLDIDPIEQPKTEQRLRDLGFGPDRFRVHRCNYAGLSQILSAENWPGADLILADLGVSSMQLDDPSRGFSVKLDGPLDMRMNPSKGRPASAYLSTISAEALQNILTENSDEPQAPRLAPLLAGKKFTTTLELAQTIRQTLARVKPEEQELSVRRVFQALRIAVNAEFSALDSFLRSLPTTLNPGGRVAILTFHSGEDRRVKKAFQSGERAGLYEKGNDDFIRASPQECAQNPRAHSAKLRWAQRAL